MTEQMTKVIKEMRDLGFAVTVFYPEELKALEIGARDAESIMIDAVENS
ncbi:MAG: hypothetical protein ACRDCI_11360 [Plesiomonas shigelloides]